MYNPEQILLFFVTALVIFILLFIVFREINCWYFKINKRLDVENEILETLKRIEEKLNNQ